MGVRFDAIKKSMAEIFHPRTPIFVFVWVPLFCLYWVTGHVVRLHEWATEQANRTDKKMLEVTRAQQLRKNL